MRSFTLALVSLGVLAVPSIATSEQVENQPALQRRDGSQITAYLDRQTGDSKQGVIVIAQGSGCGSVRTNQHINQAKRLLLPDFAVVTVEDYGVADGDLDRMAEEKCSAAFYAHHTISQRASDYRQVISYVEGQPWWDGDLVLFGGSEGGAVVQELAPVVSAKAVVVYSSATGLPFREAFVQVLPPELVATVPAALEDVRKNPNSSKVFLGNSYRWWADIMDRRLSDDLLQANEPILVVQGERDRSNPVTSARAVRDAFKSAGKANLTYWELAGYDHQMKDEAGRYHFEQVMLQISGWIRSQLPTR